MSEFLILVVLVLLIAVVLLAPLLTGRRRRALTGKLTQYQSISEALMEGDLATAREGLKSLIRTDTEDIAAYLRLARVLRREGDLERSVAVYRSLLAREVQDRGLRLQVVSGLVEDLFRLGRYDEARTASEQLRQLDRRSPLLAQVEVHEALEKEDWGRAQKAADSLAKGERGHGGPSAAQVRTFIAERRAAAGQLPGARRVLEDALRDEPHYAPALALLGDLCARQDDASRAVDAWTRLVRAHPHAAIQVIDRLEKAYFEMGRFGELERIYGDLVGAQPHETAEIQLARARMALRRGEPDLALQHVDALLDHAPEHPGARLWRLYLLLELDRAPEATLQLKQSADAALAAPTAAGCGRCETVDPSASVRCPRCGAWRASEERDA